MPTYEIRRSSRARRLAIAVYPDGRIVVTAPIRAADRTIARFYASHASWARRAFERTKKNTVIRLRRADIPRLKKQARVLALAGTRKFAARYGVAPGKVTIRAQKTRWGSCSARGNLSFNYKIAALPDALIEYVIVHEICHLRAFDHSQRFWALVSECVPDHRDRRRALRNVAFCFESAS